MRLLTQLYVKGKLVAKEVRSCVVVGTAVSSLSSASPSWLCVNCAAHRGGPEQRTRRSAGVSSFLTVG
jgi:hypothetical protein